MILRTHNTAWDTLHLSVTAVCWIAWVFAFTRDGDDLRRGVLTDAHKVFVERAIEAHLQAADTVRR